MRQRLRRCHAGEGRDIQIGNIELISMRLKIASNKSASVSIDSLDVFEPPDTWNLFGKDSVKLGIDAVSVDPD
jgi:hypothetical protein